MAEAPSGPVGGGLTGQQSPHPILTERETDDGPPAPKRLAGTPGTRTQGQDSPLIVPLPTGLHRPLTEEEELMLLAVGQMESMDVFQENALNNFAVTLQLRHLELEGTTSSAAASVISGDFLVLSLADGTADSSTGPSHNKGKLKQTKQAPSAPAASLPRQMGPDDRTLILAGLSKTVSDLKSGFNGHDAGVKYVMNVIANTGEELDEVIDLLFQHYLSPLEVTYMTSRGTSLLIPERVLKARTKAFNRETTDLRNNLPTHMESSAVFARLGELVADQMIKRLFFWMCAEYIYEGWTNARAGAFYHPSPPAQRKDMPAQVRIFASIYNNYVF